MRRIALVLLCFCLLLPSAAIAAQSAMEKSFAAGQAALKENRLDDAVTEFGKAAEALAKSGDAAKARLLYGNMAIIRIKQERWQDALDIYDKALSLPGKPDADSLVKFTRNIVVCAEKTGQNDVKAAAIERLLAAKPKLEEADRSNFLAMQGDAYRALERYRAAASAYESALKSAPAASGAKARLLTSLALCQSNLGQYPKAFASLEAAGKEAALLKAPVAEVNQTKAEVESNRGILFWETGQYGKALTSLQTALKLEKEAGLRRNEGVDSNNMGLVYKNAGKLPDATRLMNDALAIAREVGNIRDEAIALANRALLARMSGDAEGARKDYAQALELYRKAGFREGEASTLMGLARLEYLVDRKFPAAEEKLLQAAAIYEELDNPGFLAEAYVQLGVLYQKTARPNRTSRDLVFVEDDPTILDLTPEESLEKSREYFAKAQTLADQTGRKEMQWSAAHGLAFAAAESGKLAEAEKLYTKAIDLVLSLKGGDESPELLQDFLRDKDDLFAQAIAVCASLYGQTKDPALLDKQLRYDEIYRNEVMRTHIQLAAVEYGDPKKKALFEEVMQLGAGRKKAQGALRQAESGKLPESEVKAAREGYSLAEKEFEAKLALWKQQYPQDAVVFDTHASVDTAKLKASLAENQAVIQYIPLEDSLIILTVTSEGAGMTSVAVNYRDLAELIRDKFIAENIEEFGHAKMDEKEGWDQGIAILEKLSGYLYQPVRESLEGKDRLFVVTSKYLSYVPFAALVTGRDEKGEPRFLVEDKTISLTRLSFLQEGIAGQDLLAGGDIIAVGDPRHASLEVVLPPLEGARAEAEAAVAAIKTMHPAAKTHLVTGEAATKTGWKAEVAKHSYPVMYFATHGIPYAEMKYDYSRILKRVKKAEERGERAINKRDIKDYQDFISLYDKTFTNHSHLNGFLFMAYPDGNENGMLTLREIMEMPDSVFSGAKLAVLSACNTAVSYSPKVVSKDTVSADLESEQAAAELAAAGWSPGVDQVCLVDTFMKKNFRNVYGTLWFADDTASSVIMSDFLPRLKDTAPAEALRAAQLAYLKNPPKDLESDYPRHPYFWACGNIFGQ